MSAHNGLPPAAWQGLLFLAVNCDKNTLLGIGASYGLAFSAKPRHVGKTQLFQIPGNEPSAAVANGVIYTLVDGVPTALSAVDGSTLWQSPGSPSTGFPIVVNGAVYGACNGTNICAWTLPASRRTRR